MKNLIISSFQLRKVTIPFLFACILFYSCSPEDEIAPDTAASEVDKVVFTPKTLATIQMDNNVDLVFKTEEDGVVMEAMGTIENFNGLGELKTLSTLEIFLALTQNDVKVPVDLIAIEENPEVKALASKRSTIEKHADVLKAENTSALQKFEGSYCVGNENYNTYNGSDKYYRIYNNYRAGSAGTVFYSSGKPGGTKCKRVELELTNCSSSSTLRARTYYKNAFGNYKIRKTVDVSPNYCRIYRKTFGSRRYRRTNITSLSGSNNHRFGGVVLYRKY